MVRATDHESRRREVLSTVVEIYIKTGEAVSSESLCERFDCCSATMRNVMSHLEEDGYLTHRYTSSGRLPTDRGYRYYVDTLISQMELVKEEKERITKEYDRQILKLEDILAKTSEVLSAFTHCTGIASSLKLQDRIYYNGASFIAEHPEFRNFEKLRGILRFLEEKKRLLEILNSDLEKKLNIYIGEELLCQEISDCSLIVSTYTLDDEPLGRLAVLGPRNMDYGYIIPTIGYISELVGEALEDSGTTGERV